MHKFYSLTLLLLFFISTAATAQDETVKKLQKDAGKTIKKDIADTLPLAWRKGGQVSINISQGSLSNWAAGGDDFSLAINSFFNYFMFYKKGRNTWDNNLDFNFGLVQTTSLGTRKNDDRLDVLSKYGYDIGKKWYLSTFSNFRTQLFRGYTYPKTNERVFSSTFLSPAYMLVSQGFDYKPNTRFSAFISPVTARFVIVRNKTLSDSGLYGVERGERVLTEYGAFSSLNYNNYFGKNVTYKGRLDLFSNYRHRPDHIDLFMTNFFSFKISRYFSATYNLDVIYDDDVRIFGKDNKSARTQLKSIIGIGFLMKI